MQEHQAEELFEEEDLEQTENSLEEVESKDEE